MTATTGATHPDMAPGVPVMHVALAADLGVAASVWLATERTLLINPALDPDDAGRQVALTLRRLCPPVRPT